MNETDPSVVTLECIRPLKWNELVRHGDFVEDGRGGFVLWAGPRGFRAGTFVDKIWRRKECPPARVKKQS